MRRVFILPLLFWVVFAFVCTPPAHGGRGGRGERLTVAAASSARGALVELARTFEQERGVKVVVSQGSTGTLTAQIRRGAPFDLFFSADTASLASLERDGFVIRGSIEPYAWGRIALVSSGAPLSNVSDLSGSGIKRVAMANPAHAPYGRAAMEVLRSSGMYKKIIKKLVYGENVMQAVRFIQTGNADAGLVAVSVAISAGLGYAPVDEALHSPIVQSVGVVKRSTHVALALEFMRFVEGARGARVMSEYGFEPPEDEGGG